MKQIVSLFILGFIPFTLLSINTVFSEDRSKAAIVKDLILKKRELEKNNTKWKTYIKTLDAYFEKHSTDTERMQDIISKIAIAKTKLWTSAKEKEILYLINYIAVKAESILYENNSYIEEVIYEEASVENNPTNNFIRIEDILDMDFEELRSLNESANQEIDYVKMIITQWINDWIIDSKFVEDVLNEYKNNWDTEKTWYSIILLILFGENYYNVNLRDALSYMQQWELYALSIAFETTQEKFLEDIKNIEEVNSFLGERSLIYRDVTYEERINEVSESVQKLSSIIQTQLWSKNISIEDIVTLNAIRQDNNDLWVRYTGEIDYSSLWLKEDDFIWPWRNYWIAYMKTSNNEIFFQVFWFIQKEGELFLVLEWDYSPPSSSFPISLVKSLSKWDFISNWDSLE